MFRVKPVKSAWMCLNISTIGGKWKETIQKCAINHRRVKKEESFAPPTISSVKCEVHSGSSKNSSSHWSPWSLIMCLGTYRTPCFEFDTFSRTHVPWRRRDFMPTPQHFSRRFHFKHCLVSCHVGAYSWKLRSRGSFQKYMPNAHTQIHGYICGGKRYAYHTGYIETEQVQMGKSHQNLSRFVKIWKWSCGTNKDFINVMSVSFVLNYWFPESWQNTFLANRRIKRFDLNLNAPYNENIQ